MTILMEDEQELDIGFDYENVLIDWSPRRPAPHRLQIPRYDTADRGAQSRCFRSCPLRHKKKRCSSRLKQIEFLAYA